MIKTIVFYMLIALVLTIIIETLIAFLLFKIKDKKDLLIVMLVNVLTNPLVNSISTFCLYNYGFKAKDISMVVLEILAFISEALIYSKALTNKKTNPFILSFVLNASSYLMGVLINTIM